MVMEKNRFDVAIVGGGPAGCTAALYLAQTGLRIAVIDRSSLPAHKVCGDALSGTVLRVIKDLDPGIYCEFMDLPAILPSRGIRFVSPGGFILDLPFAPGENQDAPVPGVTCNRREFDGFLVSLLGRHSNISLFPGRYVKKVSVSHDEGQVTISGEGFSFYSQVVVGADGANSIVGRCLSGNQADRKKLCLGVRGYFKGVTELHPENFIELHFIKELLPGYLWIFPMIDGKANVGVGFMPGKLPGKGISADSRLLNIINSYPALKNRFTKASLQDKTEAHILPLGPDNKNLTGERYLLLGDAASLVDPFSGEGIGNAMVSGKIAAGFIKEAFMKNDFSASFFNKKYEDEIRKKLVHELKTSKIISRLVSMPALFDFVIKRVNSNDRLKNLFSEMYSSLDVRKKLKDPLFYLTMVTEPRKTSSS
jgi:menaquinone-9 beta-reductase